LFVFLDQNLFVVLGVLIHPLKLLFELFEKLIFILQLSFEGLDLLLVLLQQGLSGIFSLRIIFLIRLLSLELLPYVQLRVLILDFFYQELVSIVLASQVVIPDLELVRLFAELLVLRLEGFAFLLKLADLLFHLA
jgi:hypothetical protein